MKRISITSVAFVCMAAVAFSGCAGSDHQAKHIGNVGGGAPLASRDVGAGLETISYSWEDLGINVSFCKRDRETVWGMTVRDSGDIYKHFTEPGKVWGLSVSRCSKEECLRLIDRSLTRFQAEKPNARFEYVALEMQVVRELWSEILVGLSQKLSTMDAKKSDEPGDIPPEIYNEVKTVLNKSTTVAQIKLLLKKHGVDAHDVNIADQVLFKTSLNGQKWSAIAASPGLGIEVPGVVEFDLGKSRTGSASKNGVGPDHFDDEPPSHPKTSVVLRVD